MASEQIALAAAQPPPEIALEDKIAAAVQKALAAVLPTCPPAPLPAAPQAAEILPENADEDFYARREALDFDLEAAAAVENAAEKPDPNKLAVIAHCRVKLAAAAFEPELETVRAYAAKRGLLAAGAELGFRVPTPGAETDLERQQRQRQFEAETAPQPVGTEVREGNGRPVLSAWGSAIDPRVIGQ